MLLCYIDESGNTGTRLDDPNQPTMFVGGVVVHETKWRACKSELSTIIRDAATQIEKQVPKILRSGSRAMLAWSKVLFPGMQKTRRADLDQDEILARVPDYFAKGGRFELHATDLFTGSGAFYGVDHATRTSVAHGALGILGRHGCVFLGARIDKVTHAKRYVDPHPVADCVMVCFTELLDGYAESQGERALMISDKVAKPEDMRAKLARYQDHRTPYGPGRPIVHVIDSIHFVDSVESPLVQLADLCTYLLSHDQRSTGQHAKEWARVRPHLHSIKRFN